MKQGPKVVAIVQVRMGSTRLPGKNMAEVLGRPSIWHLFRQLGFSKRLDALVLATTVNAKDEPLVGLAKEENWLWFRGSESDVLDRYYQAAKWMGCSDTDVVVRVTGDDILVDPEVLDQVVDLYLAHPEVRYASNNLVRTYPFGADVEVFSLAALRQAWVEAKLPDEREHVTPYIRTHPEKFPNVELRLPNDFSHIRIAIDYPEDLVFMRQLVTKLHEERQPPFHVADIIACVAKYELKHPRSSPTN